MILHKPSSISKVLILNADLALAIQDKRLRILTLVRRQSHAILKIPTFVRRRSQAILNILTLVRRQSKF